MPYFCSLLLGHVSAGKILPGGAAPGLDTLVSMIALSKIATPVLAAGKGVSALGKAVTTPTGGDGASLASWAGTGLAGLLGRTSTTLSARPTYEQIRQSGGALTYKDRLTTTVNGTGLLGGLEKVGVALGSKSTGMGAAAVGGASVLGGLAALGTTISGLNDVYSAINSKERDERAAKGVSGGMKLGGVGMGAVIGSMILPGAGTLIGAGIGGAIGYVSGNSVKKHYEEQAQAAQEAAAKEAAAHELITAKAAYTGQSIQEITFKSRELNKAFQDTETSADTFYTMFREAVNEKIAGSFGDISFSLQEIRDMAKSIVFDSGIAGVEKFQESVAKTEKRLSALKADMSALEKLNWQAGVGIQFTEADVSNYREQTDAFVKDAQNYLRDKHYEATIAFKLLTDGNGDLSGVDSVYASLQEELDSKSSELQAKVKIALDDGVIQLDELEEITNLQNQISDIMNRVSAAEESAKLDTLKIKYGGADMDVASFRQLQSDIAEFMKSAEDTDYEAYTIALTNLKLQFPDGGEAYEAAVAELNANLNRRREERLNRTLTIELQTIVENNDLNLDSVWPDLSGDVSAMASRLRELMNSALAVQPDPIQWTEGQVSQWFNLSGMDAVSLSAFTEMIKGVAETLPQTVREQIGAAIATANEAIATTDNIDMSGALDAIPESAAEAARNTDMSPVSDAISDKMTDSINVGMENLGDAEIEMSALKDAAETGVNETLGDINVQAGADAMTANAGTAITDSMSALDMSGANEALTTIVGDGFTEAMGGVNFTEGTGVLTTNVTSSVTEGMSGLDFSAASEAVRVILSAAIAAGISGTDLSAAFAELTALRQRVEAQAKATLGAQMTIQVPVNLTYNYNVTNPTPPKPTVTAQSYTANVSAHASGGFVNGAELSWVGEDGPEAIIPLGAKRRGRGLELYRQVGEILGVAENAEGGVYGVADSLVSAHYNNRYDNHYGNRYDNRSVSSVTGGSSLSNYDNRSASGVTNQFAGASVAHLAPDGLHIIQYPRGGTDTVYDMRDARTNVSSVTENGNVFSSSLSTHDTRSSAALSVLTENNSAETAYDIRDSRTADYRFDKRGGISNIRAGNMYEGDLFLSAPVTNAYDAGTRNSASDMTAVRNIQNSLTSSHAHPVSQIRSGDRYESSSAVTNIRNAGNKAVSETSFTDMFPLVYGDRDAFAYPHSTASYDMSRSAANSYSYQTGANAETAYDILNSSPLSVLNGGDSFARSFLNDPTSIYDARTDAESFTDMSRGGNTVRYGAESPSLALENATAYSAREGAETPFESRTGFYPVEAERGDSGAETAPFSISDASADNGTMSGAAVQNAPVTINVTLTPNFSFSNTGDESDGKMEALIRRCMKESADDLAAELAELLTAVYENSPRR